MPTQYGVPESTVTYQGTPLQLTQVVSRELPVHNPYYNPAGSAALHAAGGPPPVLMQDQPYATAAWAYNPLNNSVQPLIGYPSAYPHVVNAYFADTAAPYVATARAAAQSGAERRARVGGPSKLSSVTAAATRRPAPAPAAPSTSGAASQPQAQRRVTGAERAAANAGPYYTQEERNALLREMGLLPPLGNPPTTGAAPAPAPAQQAAPAPVPVPVPVPETVPSPAQQPGVASPEDLPWTFYQNPFGASQVEPAPAPAPAPSQQPGTATQEDMPWSYYQNPGMPESIAPLDISAALPVITSPEQALPGYGTLAQTALLGAIARNLGIDPADPMGMQKLRQAAILLSVPGGAGAAAANATLMQRLLPAIVRSAR